MSKWVVWFAWYPVVMAIEVPIPCNSPFFHTHLATRHVRVWLRFVARRWNPGFQIATGEYGKFEYAPAWRAVTQ